MYEIPDDKTMDMTLYGSSYPLVSTRLDQIDLVIEALNRLVPDLTIFSVDELDYAIILIQNDAAMVFGSDPLPEDMRPEIVDVALKLRDLAKSICAEDLLIDTKKQIEKYGKSVGSSEYSLNVKVKEDLWKEAQIYDESRKVTN